ncbi:hypothetical protein ACFLV7_06240 [Chloroflexota bacterium]
MDKHVRILGWLWIIFGVLGILGALCIGISTAGGGLISQDDTAILATSIVAVVCGGFFFLGNVLNIIAGVGLLKYKSWARTLAIISGIFNLFAFPIGTALGIYTFWVMFNEETKQIFKSGFASSELPEENTELSE